jgi:hypothetical protein
MIDLVHPWIYQITLEKSRQTSPYIVRRRTPGGLRLLEFDEMPNFGRLSGVMEDDLPITD